ncbi:cyclodeaminase/cyclohydrolase family protein [Spelaeicoccus albus]|uniref:Formiminotetrahydrofolate cyclodeaminase n=1 Tax=Spelaeicoccus albus TaxID=1280376 RepID=A0A7Z0IIJ9_9MICO|nr:cyclodeaminase/cyclohydrolase family protein [Spelaeicoccus albus]NYI68437.1 formiminotetrahydrofolate cyclodeaminase [Spelaeicoccus albus]
MTGTEASDRVPDGADGSGRDYRERPLADLLADIAGSGPVPAAGSTIAATAAMAAGLVAKTAARSAARFDESERVRADAAAVAEELASLITEDARLYAAALAVPKSERAAAFGKTTVVPLAVATAGETTARLAWLLVRQGNPNLRFDAAAAAALAAAAAQVAVTLLEANSSGGVAEASKAAEKAAEFARECAKSNR